MTAPPATYKQWVIEEAQRLGISTRALYVRLCRNRHPRPPGWYPQCRILNPIMPTSAGEIIVWWNLLMICVKEELEKSKL